jgi:hypothetical protein
MPASETWRFGAGRDALRNALTLVAAACLFGGCTSTTTIRSNPSGATVYLDERPQGVTPYSLSETTWGWTNHKLRLEKEGSRPVETEFGPHASGARIALWSVLFLFTACPVGYLSCVDYDPEYRFNLAPDPQAMAARAAAEAEANARFAEGCKGAPGDNPFELRCYEATRDVEHLARALKAAKSRPEQCAALTPVLTTSLHPAEDAAKMGADPILIEECRSSRVQAAGAQQAQKQCLVTCESNYNACQNTPVQQHLLEEHAQGCRNNRIDCETSCRR